MIITQISCQFAPRNIATAINKLEQVRDKMQTSSGCLFYQVSVISDQPASVIINQHWQNMTFFDQYRNSEEFASMIGEIKPTMTQPPKTDVYDVQIQP